LIPVLVGNASMPRDNDLPKSLKELRLKNAISVRPDPDFHHDVDRLIRGLRELPVLERSRSRSSATVETLARTFGPLRKLWTAVSLRNRLLLSYTLAVLAPFVAHAIGVPTKYMNWYLKLLFILFFQVAFCLASGTAGPYEPIRLARKLVATQIYA